MQILKRIFKGQSSLAGPAEVDNSTYCKAPHIWQVISAQGDIKPCCAYRGQIGHINAGGADPTQFNSLVESLNNGVKDKGCQECWHRESLGFGSHRLHSEMHKEMSNQLRFLEFNFSNLCNLKCRMCNGDSSTKWIEDELAIQKDSNLDFRYRHGTHKSDAFPTDESLLEYLKNTDLQKVERLTFKGGEPLLHKQVFLATDYFKELKKTNLQIQFTSSGTIFSKRLESLSNFDEVEFTFSIEAVGTNYQYIRGGHAHDMRDIEKLLKFLKTIPNFKIISNSCIPAYSFFSLGELYSWLVKNIPHNKENFVDGHFVSVDNPDYLSVKAIPKELRERALEKNIKVLKDEGVWSQRTESQFERLLSIEDGHDEALKKKFIIFTRKLDALRDQDICEAIPEYSSMFKNYYE